ncbi:alpha-L-rhamnosidase [Streptomyces phage ZL12]|uniref:Alpha-L-rhamnosidase n=1 Tax=Streptomyces phage ZL12 TaxID=2570911 RepID=D0UWC8_9CAUD|nr:alpha-L-rhamnosidase [Streptomyces phage ZL12]ACX71100.1 alpha-L-rhamnosidase [Streptomyces phage ZL12]
MNQPTTADPAAAPDAPSPAHVDRALADRCQSSGDYLAGLLAAGHLEAAGTVRKLPTAMFPDWPAEMVQAVWDAAVPIGFQAGRTSVRPTWAPDALHTASTVLNDAGYEAMGRLAARSATLHPPRHPADGEQSAWYRGEEPGTISRNEDGW